MQSMVELNLLRLLTMYGFSRVIWFKMAFCVTERHAKLHDGRYVPRFGSPVQLMTKAGRLVT